MRELTFLSRIAASTETRNNEKKKILPFKKLESLVEKNRSSNHFEKVLTKTGRPNIIAEIKRKSPSQGQLIEKIMAGKLAQEYHLAGASAVSVLTEPTSFGGSLEDLIEVRKLNTDLPILQKDFIIDPYQIYEASLIGSSAILLIVALLGERKLREFHLLAASLGLSVLVEVHTLHELEVALKINSKIVGVNNRDLHSLKVSLDVSRTLIEALPESVIAVSESGISSAEEIKELHNLGYDAFLIGSSFMRTTSPASALSHFMQELR